MPDFIPRRDADLRTWVNTFNATINAAPGNFGVTVAQAAELAAVHDTYLAAYQTANAAQTRSPSNIIAKDEARKALVDFVRLLSRIVRATPAVTSAQRLALGLGVPSAGPSAISAPVEPPSIRIVSVVGSIVRVRLFDSAAPTRRGKARHAAGAMVFTWVGDTPSPDLSDWHFHLNTTRTSVDVRFNSDVLPGSKVWVTAYWYSPTAAHGMASQPVGTHIGFPTLMMAA